MASLTPGVLSKLIGNAGNKDFKVTGEHRSPILQVLEIVPSLPGAGDDQDDPWKSRGFFLKVSDSLHSAYVSISDEDLDLIYSDKIQLGQFVSVSRLDASASGSRVPILRGLKPVAKRRPCVGNPTDLVSSDALPIGRGVGLSKRASKSKPQARTKNANNEEKPRKMEPCRGVLVGNVDKNINKKVVESRRLSLDSVRRGWDQGPPPINAVKSTSYFNPKSNHIASPGGCNKKASSENGSAIRPPILKTSPLKNKNETFSQKAMSKVIQKDMKSPTVEASRTHLIQLPLNSKTQSEKKVLWSALPSTMAIVGKRTVRHRNVAYMAAAHALEEASAMEGIIHCMCLFAELSGAAHQVSAGPLAEQFLELYQRIQQAQTTLNSFLKKMPSDSNLESGNKNATSWVQAAIGTNLCKFKLFSLKDGLETQTCERHLYVVVENTMKDLDFENHFSRQTKPNPKNHRNCPSDLSTKRPPFPSKALPARKDVYSKMEEWSKGSGLEEASKLGEDLLLVSRQWFTKYLEDLLSNGFGISRGEQSSDVGHLLRQLTRVNQWMDELIKSGVEVDDQIEQLRKKLFKFLLEHVDKAAALVSQ